MADVVGPKVASQLRTTISRLRSRNQYPRLIAELKKCSESEQVGRLRNLCRTDLFFLLRYGCGRADVDRDWVFDRSREVQAAPHGHLDLARTYVAIKELSEAGDKPAKARSFQGRMATGKVYFPKQAEWLDDLVMEMSMFPVGHDDQIDSLALVGRMLDEMVGGRVPTAVVEPDNRDDYRSYSRSEADAENDWKTI